MRNPSKANHQTFLTLLLGMGVVLSLLLAGCNTIQGAGEDIENLGEDMEDVAN